MDEFMKYLSPEARAKLSMTIDGNKDNLQQKAYIMYDGTIITVEKNKDKPLADSYLENPNGIRLTGAKAMVKISYSNPDDTEFAKAGILLIARTMNELGDKWKTYKHKGGFPEDLMGTIESIDLTEEQKNRIVDIEDAVNNVLNLIMDDDTAIGETIDHKTSRRYDLIGDMIGSISRTLLLTGTTDKVRVPNIKTDPNTGNAVEILDYISTKSIYDSLVVEDEPDDF